MSNYTSRKKYAVKKSRTPEEIAEWKEQKLAEQKQLLEGAVTELTTSEHWQNWIKYGRNNLRKYSFNNALLIWAQKRDAFNVAGKVQWSKQGVTVDAEAQPIHILAPQMIQQRDKQGNPLFDANGKKLMKVGFYRTVQVYDVSETDAPKVDKVETMVQPEGDDLIVHMSALEGFARELGVFIKFKEDTRGAEGYFDPINSEIVLNRKLQGNALIRTLVHELCHAFGNVNYTDYSREDAEVLVESATVMALGMIGFDISASSVPYIAAWGGDLEVLKKNALLVDTMVKEFADRMGL